MRAADAGMLVAVLFTLLSATGRAEVGTVFYRDGGRISGEIVEVRPEQFVVVKTATGETRRIDWAEVDHVSSPATPRRLPAAPALQTPPPPPPNAPQVEEPPTGTVVLRSNVPSTAVQVVAGRAVGYVWGSWAPVTVSTGQGRTLCVAPCRARLPLGLNDLMVAAPGAPPAYVQVDVRPGENFLVARMGSSAMVNGGYAATTVGVLALITGASFLLTYGFYPNSYGYSYYSGYYGWGLGAVIGGAVLTGGGVALMAFGASSVGPDSAAAAHSPVSALPSGRGLGLALRF